MGRNCSIYNCKTGLRSCREKVSLFHVPSAKVDQWQKLLPKQNRTITAKDYICAKHFEKKYVLKQVNTTLHFYNLANPRLTPDAIPTIFSDYDKRLLETSEDEPAERVPEEMEIEEPTYNLVSSIYNSEPAAMTDPLEIKQEDLHIKSEPILEVDVNEIGTEDSNSQINDKAISEDLFSHIWNGDLSVSLPSDAWGLHCAVLHIKMLVFTEVVPSFDGSTAYTRKKMILAPSVVKLFAYEHHVENPPLKIEPFSSLQQLEDFLERLHLLHVCSGARKPELPSGKVFRNYVEDPYLQGFRHLNCPYFTDNKTCKNCRNFCKSLLNLNNPTESKVPRVSNEKKYRNFRKRLNRLRLKHEKVRGELVAAQQRIKELEFVMTCLQS